MPEKPIAAAAMVLFAIALPKSVIEETNKI
jgi:hypothetical protein